MDLIKIILKNVYITIHMSPPSDCQRWNFYFLLPLLLDTFFPLCSLFCVVSPSTILSAPRARVVNKK